MGLPIRRSKFWIIFNGVLMQKKVAQYIADFLVEKGVTDVFTVTGGGAMHLNDAFGHQPFLRSIYNHHEQACSIAAEGYARLTDRVAAVCVTSGPGGTNAITGVLGGWQDSIPMFIVSGQVKRETTTWSTDVPVRQLGDQEFQIIDCVKGMTKYAVMVTDPESIRYHLEKAWYYCNNGRKGPVWLDIPLDVQAALIDDENLVGFDVAEIENPENPYYDQELTQVILGKLSQAKRPVILAGTGIRLGEAQEDLLALVEKLNIPVVTAWNAHDVIANDNPCYCGRPGTVGTRGGNFIVQNCDVLLVLGCRMNIRQISYNRLQFAQNAQIIMVDIDEAELRKPTIKVDVPIHANVKDVIGSLLEATKEDFSGIGQSEDHLDWLKWARATNEEYPATLASYYNEEKLINPYVFITELSRILDDDDVVVCGNGSACVITFQAFEIQNGQRLFTNSGCAAMGYGFPAALGCAVARDPKRVICIDGDGSFQMNIQELQTVVHNRLNLKIIILNNNGYHSIRQTQTNLFNGQPLVGVSEDNGISFPSFEKLADVYGLPYCKIETEKDFNQKMENALFVDGPILIEVVVDSDQNFEPKLSSKVLEDGSIVSPELDDMFPFLPREEYEAHKLV